LHAEFLRGGLFTALSSGFVSLDAQRPWICYWTTHGLDLLGHELSPEEKVKVIRLLGLCQSSDGGFGGGPGQLPHLAPTFAAVCTLITLGTKEAYEMINRPKLLKWLLRLKQPDGSCIMHQDGEVDLRCDLFSCELRCG